MHTSVGETLGRIRRARGFTQEELSAAAGVSVDVIARLEQGRRQTARWSTLSRLARSLDVQLSELVAPAPMQLRDRSDDGALLALRRSITTLTDLPGITDFAEDRAVAPLAQVAAEIDQAWWHYQAGEYSLVARALPALLADAYRNTQLRNNEAKAQACSLLATACHMAAGVAVMQGREDLAFTAVERALVAANQADSELPRAASVVFLAWILLKQGRYSEAEAAAVRMAELIEPSFATATRAQLATFGNLLVNASAAAVRADQGSRAAELLSVASGAAARLGMDTVSRHAVFGPRVVGMMAVNNAVELGEMDVASRLTRRVPAQRAASEPTSGELRRAVPPSWDARYLLNVAYAHSELGADADAVDALWRARQIAGEWLTYHPLGRAVVRELLERVPRRTSARLRELAHHLQVY